ncbi:cytochrome P450 [Chryseobacterium mucoviscidosis]|uniref:cytochrome P450 n=1 Tax=Paenibacillus sp. 11B TaxID=3060965 RepID=UPI0009A318E2|nr:cytochrome P450 [Paenibacillus sp. 11B]MDN8587595.1 cytochrome P450 [Paenibacillus sp. 11B]OPG95976.1 cytochrome P450 [Chryseobacterium mucoviscidosis]
MSNPIISLSEMTDFESKEDEFSPHHWYRHMLKQDPVVYNEASDSWHVFGYDLVKTVLNDHEHFSSERQRTIVNVGYISEDDNNNEGEHHIPDRLDIHNVDPPEHRKRRSLLANAFTPRSLRLWEPRIQALAEQLVAKFAHQPVVDIVEAYTSVFPVMIMSDLLGVPSKDHHLFKEWVNQLFLPSTHATFAEINEMKKTAGEEYFKYLYPVVVAKRLNPGEDIISDLIRAEVDGDHFSDEEIVRTTMFILGAGVETTSILLANSFYAMLYDQPGVYAELRKNPELIPNAVEEMLRYRFNISKMDRMVKKDNNLLGIDLKKGDAIVAWMSAANVDERVFEDPFTFNIHRSNNNKQISFGYGTHFCLGAPLARLEAKIALSTFIQTFSRIENVEGFILEDNLVPAAVGQSLNHLPLKLYK